MVSGGRGCGCCRWHFAKLLPVSRPAWCEKREAICRGQKFRAEIMGSATHDWPGHVDSVSHVHTVFYKWRVLHLRKITFSRWFQQTLVLLKNKNIPARFPAKEVESHPVRAWIPASSFWSWSLSMNDPQWCEQEHVIFSSRFSNISFCQNAPAVAQQHM